MSTIIPWIESVTSADDSLEDCLPGLKLWEPHASSVIVTTWSKYVPEVYPWLRDRTDMRFHGGFKVHDLLSQTFDDPAEWAEIARHVGIVAGTAESNVVLLDCEVALDAFFHNKSCIDFARLTESLKPLADTGVQIHFYQPSIQPNTPAFPLREYFSMRLIHTIAEALPNCIFDATPFAWANWPDNERDAIGRWQLLCRLVGSDRVQQRIIVTDTGRYADRDCHTPERARSLLSLLGDRSVVIYPGQDRWTETAAAWPKGD